MATEAKRCVGDVVVSFPHLPGISLSHLFSSTYILAALIERCKSRVAGSIPQGELTRGIVGTRISIGTFNKSLDTGKAICKGRICQRDLMKILAFII